VADRIEADEGAAGLERVSRRLEEVAKELAADPDDARADELVKEASQLAADAGEELGRMLGRLPEARP
jgi:hypothetical protein